MHLVILYDSEQSPGIHLYVRQNARISWHRNLNFRDLWSTPIKSRPSLPWSKRVKKHVRLAIDSFTDVALQWTWRPSLCNSFPKSRSSWTKVIAQSAHLLIARTWTSFPILFTATTSQTKVPGLYKINKCWWKRRAWRFYLLKVCWPPGRSILVPLTSSLYVPGKLKNAGKVLVDVGTGYYIEKARDLMSPLII